MRFTDPKDPSEDIVVEFDFSAIGAATLSSPAVTASVRWADGTPDPNPSNIRSGAPQIVGLVVRQKIVGGLNLHDYNLRCTVQTEAGTAAVVGAILMVRTKPVA